VGWGDPTGGVLFFGPDVAPSTSFIEWASDFSGNYDVEISNSLSGFSVNTVAGIGQPVAFALNGSTNFATAQEMSDVPEPGTLVLLPSVLLGILILRRFGTTHTQYRQAGGSVSRLC